jgi:glycine/D-amino acid oxidase-like deaminating enzyme
MPQGRVVIIGAGVSGALCAVRLAERGFAVTVVEKALVGNGSSSRSAAGIRAQFSTEATIVGMMYSEWWYCHVHELLQLPEAGRQPVIRQNGYLFLYEHPERSIPPWRPHLRREAAASWQRAQETVALQQRLGLPVELLEPAAIGRRWPHLVTERLIGATWCPTDGFLFPAVIYGEGFRRAQDLGVRLMQRTEVTGARLRGGRIIAVETTHGALEAEWFVNCTNAWAPRTSRVLGGMTLPIAPIKRYLYFLKPERPIMSAQEWERLPMTICGMGAGRGAHFRPDGTNLLLAWGHPADPEPEFSDDDQDRIAPRFSHKEGVDNYGYAVLQELEQFAPELMNCGRLVATTSGYYGITPDANPLIGIDANQSNLVHAAGFSGHGVMHAPITAVLVEAIIAGDARQGRVRLPAPFDQHTIDLAAFDPKRDFSHSQHEAAVL